MEQSQEVLVFIYLHYDHDTHPLINVFFYYWEMLSNCSTPCWYGALEIRNVYEVQYNNYLPPYSPHK